MIKFFRRIRQKLLSENKFSKYFLYAIGEIILVVIGILIALQINEWNQEKQNLKLKDTYLIGLKTDAENDIRKLDGFIKTASKYTTKVDSFMLVKNGALSKKDLDQIGIVRQTYFITDGTFQEIIANGHLKLLPGKIKQELLAQTTFFKATNKIDAANTENVNKQHLKMGNYFELQRREGPSLYQVISYPHTDIKQATLVYRNYINICTDWMKLQQRFYNRLKQQHLKVVALIDKELAK